LLGAMGSSRTGSLRWSWDGKQHRSQLPASVFKHVPFDSRWRRWKHEMNVKMSPSNKILTSLGYRATKIGAMLELVLLPHIAIRPANVAIFRHPQNTVPLWIVGGSGAMRVTLSENSLVDAQVDYNRRSINLTPKECGSLKITVEDTGLHGSDPVHANVLVSDLTKVELDVVQQLELKAQTTAKLHLYAADGTEFPESQYKYMDFSYEYDKQRLKVEADSAGLALVTGVGSGPAFISVTATGISGTPSRSDKRQINVFSRLQLMPRHLHLLLGGEFQFQGWGGPVSGYKAHFTNSNSTVASMHSSEGWTKALELGDATVSLTEYSLETGKELAKDSAKLTVITLDQTSHLKISQPSSKLLIDNQMSVYVTGPFGESPFMFSFAKEKRFRWEVSDPSILLLVDSDGKKVPESNNGSFGTRLHGVSSGRAVVTAHVEWDPPCCTGSQCMVHSCERHTVSLTAKASVVVVAGLAILGPSTVVLPRNTKYLIRTNMDPSQLIFQATGKGALQVDSAGLVTTLDNFNSCHVIVSTASGDQSIAVTFHIRQIAQLMLVMPPLQRRREDHIAVTMPLGGSAQLDVQVQDDLGTTFTTIHNHGETDVSSSLRFLEDRTDVLNVNVHPSGQSLTLSAVHQGMVALRVWLRDSPAIDDYLRIMVDNIIEPAVASVLIGGSVQYSVALRNTSLPSTSRPRTTWSSNNPSIVAVHADSGRATALATGMAHISVEGAVRSYVQLSVVTLGSAHFKTEESSQFVYNYEGAEYAIELDVKDRSGRSLYPPASSKIDHKVKVQCWVEPSQSAWAIVRAGSNAAHPSCIVHPQLPEIASEEDLHHLDRLQIYAQITDSSEASILKTNTSIGYMHAFRISYQERSMRAPERLRLSLTLGETEVIQLYGNADHVVPSSDDPDVVAVKLERFTIGGARSFQIHRTGRSPRKRVEILKVSFQCRITQQIEVVEIQLVDSGQLTLEQLWYLFCAYLEQAWSQLNAVLAGIIILVAIYFLFNNPPPEELSYSPSQPGPAHQSPLTGHSNLDADSPRLLRSPIFDQDSSVPHIDCHGRATLTTPQRGMRRYDMY